MIKIDDFKDPYRQEIKLGLKALKNINGSAPIFQIVHGIVGSLATENLLSPEEWIIIKLVDGVKVIVHRDFLSTQNDFNRLETGETSSLFWNADLTLQSLQDFISTILVYRKKHEETYNKALSLLNSQDREDIESFCQTNFVNNQEGFLLVAIPSPFDNKKLWIDEFGFSEEQLGRLNFYSKIHECGVILASRIYRDDRPRGHDFFSYAARLVVQGKRESIQEELLQTAKHEGSHGKIDMLILSMLEISNSNPIDEGLANVLSGYIKEDEHTTISLIELINNPKPLGDELAQYRKEATYLAGSKFFYSLFMFIKNKQDGLGNKSDEIIWSRIIAKMIELALQINKENSTRNDQRTENEKISDYMKRLIKALNIPLLNLENIYNGLNLPK